ncbi:MAG: deoxyribodipyrimidine photolyase [Planctomycetes bacterium]|nr:deoxyribodipyrimidine photolyase [Planctomycetota bacterium]
MPAPHVPPLRVRARNERPRAARGAYVLYWMIAARRTGWNFALDRAIELGQELRKPVLIFEALRVGQRWNGARHQRFVLDGLRANRDACRAAGVGYFPYVEPEHGAGAGLLAALAHDAAAVVTDEFPGYFLPRMVEAAARQLDARLESVDANGLLPLRATEAAFPTAYAFRRFLQKNLRPHLATPPLADPLEAAARLGGPVEVPPAIARRWAPAADALLEGDARRFAALPLDHGVPPVAKPGGSLAARAALRAFVRHKLPRYAEERSDPSADTASGFSPWLHFGHLSTHEVLAEIARHEAWKPERTALTASGKKDGWWNLPPSAEAFLDELVTWRELGYGFAYHRADAERYESLPDWARATLDEHARDPRAHVYSLEEFERALTHDALWNAAQRQLVREGRIHNYLRMLWGKKILEWTPSPRAALEVLFELNNRWALDGRDPNSTSGICWTLGRFDRPWGPVRPVFGTIRYMSSENTARKLDVKPYLARYAGEPAAAR